MPSLLINLIFFLFICWIVNRVPINKNKKDNIIVVFACFQVIFFQTFKDINSLPDILGYVRAWNYICEDNSTWFGATYYYKMQYGYFLYNKLLSYISHEPLFFTFATGCIISLPYIFIIKKYSPIIWFSLVLYMMSFTQSTFVLRQYTSIALCIIAFPLLFKHEYIKSVVLWLIAISIHPTAVFGGITFVLYFIRSNKWFIIGCVILFAVLVRSLPLLMVMFTDNVDGYNYYLGIEGVDYSTVVLNLFYAVTFYYFVIMKRDVTEEESLMMKMSVITFIIPLAAIFTGTSVVVPRLIMYMTFVQFIIIPKTLQAIKKRFLKVCLGGIYFFLNYYLFMISDKTRAIDFRLIFE